MSLYRAIRIRLLRSGGLALALWLPSLAWARLEVGATFPEFSRFSIEGKAPLYHGKVALVDFWASWCAPCKASFPVFSKLHDDYSSKLVIIGVNIDEKDENYRQFISRYKPSFPTVRDDQQQLVAAVEVPAMPTSYLIDRRGAIRFVHVGFHDGTAAELRQEIDQLLKE